MGSRPKLPGLQGRWRLSSTTARSTSGYWLVPGGNRRRQRSPEPPLLDRRAADRAGRPGDRAVDPNGAPAEPMARHGWSAWPSGTHRRDHRSLQQLQLLETDYQSALVAVADLKAPLETDERGRLHCQVLPAPPQGPPETMELSRSQEACGRLEHG